MERRGLFIEGGLRIFEIIEELYSKLLGDKDCTLNFCFLQPSNRWSNASFL